MRCRGPAQSRYARPTLQSTSTNPGLLSPAPAAGPTPPRRAHPRLRQAVLPWAASAAVGVQFTQSGAGGGTVTFLMKPYGKRNSLFQNFVMSQLAALQVILTKGGGSCQLRPVSDREHKSPYLPEPQRQKPSPWQGDCSPRYPGCLLPAGSVERRRREELAAIVTGGRGGLGNQSRAISTQRNIPVPWSKQELVPRAHVPSSLPR